jgi:hypothetical protein
MNFFLDKIVSFTTLSLVGVFRGQDGDMFSMLTIKRNKGQLDVVENLSFHDFESLNNKLDKKIPVLLLIDGKGILNKRVDLKKETDAEWLKNLDYKSIHYTKSISAETEFLSFCRNNIVEEYVSLFGNTNVQVLDFYIGSAVSVLLKGQVGRNSFYSNQTILQYSGETLLAVTKSEGPESNENYDIGGANISNFHIPLYAAAINFYIKDPSIIKSHLDAISSEEIVYKKAFEKIGVLILAGFFVTLLTSYALIQYFINENAALGLENSYSYKSYDLVKKMESEKDDKLKILNETGFSSKKFISYYCYELVREKPQQISFSNLDVYPLKKEVKNTEKVLFDYKTISLKGQTNSKSVFNSWIDYLKDQPWIKTLEIVSVKRDKKEVTYFELKITVSDV